MLLPDCGCCGGGCCSPETITIELGNGTGWKLMPVFSGFGTFQGLNFLSTTTKATLGLNTATRQVTASPFNGVNTAYATEDDAGPHFSCQSPESAEDKCMRLSPQRLLDFMDDIGGSYVLQRNPDCQSYSYVNTASCTQNLVRELRLEVALASQNYPLQNPFLRQTNCTAGYTTYPGRGLSGWIEYRLSAEICIAGDKGSNEAVGCYPDILNEGDPARCNCIPTGFSITYNSPPETLYGPCTYSGECYASLTFHSVSSQIDNVAGALARLRQPYLSSSYLEKRAVWAETSGSVDGIDLRPTNSEIANGALWCAVDSNVILLPGVSMTGDEEAYVNASCLQVPDDVYFILATVSPVTNYHRLVSGEYEKSFRDMFGIGAKLRKTVVP